MLYLLWEAIVGKGEIQFWLGGKVGDTLNIHHLKTIIYKINTILDFNCYSCNRMPTQNSRNITISEKISYSTLCQYLNLWAKNSRKCNQNCTNVNFSTEKNLFCEYKNILRKKIQPTNDSWLINWLVSWLLGQLNWLLGWLVSWFFGELVSSWFGNAINWLFGRTVSWLFGRLVRW